MHGYNFCVVALIEGRKKAYVEQQNNNLNSRVKEEYAITKYD
jgi:hypothetical protein